MSGHTIGGMSDLTIPSVDVPPRWTRCVVCGNPTSQPPVCHDLRCEVDHYGHDYETESAYIEGE